MLRLVCWTFLVSWVAVPFAWADSPLTSTDLASAYKEIPAVGLAGQTHEAAGEVLSFLLSDAPSDQKAAVVNALGWKFEGQKNGLTFAHGLADAKKKELEKLTLKDLTPIERMVLGYLLALDDYFTLKPLSPKASGLLGANPVELLDSAAQELPQDFTVAIVRGLVRAQKIMDKNWCQVFQETDQVFRRFPRERRNLRQAAQASIEEYMGAYEENCPGSKAAAKKKREELNQNYSLVKLGEQIVAGTQGGVVVWDPKSKTPIAKYEEFICGHLVVFGGSAWAGCDRQVVRWDGQAFWAYLKNRKNDARYFAPLLGPEGKLWVRYGKQTFAYNPKNDRFDPVQALWKGDPYDVVVQPDGEVWWIDFLRAIHRGGKTYELRSEFYPGGDPRTFSIDALGRLWIEDFEGGLFRLDPKNGRFVHEAGLDNKGAGVAFDLKTERLWLLHYTDGLVLKQNDKVLETIDLRELGYMRSFLLDPSGDVWVAGWNCLLRIHEQGGGFQRESYRVE